MHKLWAKFYLYNANEYGVDILFIAKLLSGIKPGMSSLCLEIEVKFFLAPFHIKKCLKPITCPHLILAIFIFWNTCNEIQPSLKELGEGINQKPRNLEISK
jgi:hypothetical protein